MKYNDNNGEKCIQARFLVQFGLATVRIIDLPVRSSVLLQHEFLFSIRFYILLDVKKSNRMGKKCALSFYVCNFFSLFFYHLFWSTHQRKKVTRRGNGMTAMTKPTTMGMLSYVFCFLLLYTHLLCHTTKTNRGPSLVTRT